MGFWLTLPIFLLEFWCLQDRIPLTSAWTSKRLLGKNNHSRFHAQQDDKVRQHKLCIYSTPPPQTLQDNEYPSTAKDKVVRIYTRPSLYDMAFGYRDFQMETKNMLKWHKDAALYPATSVLEVAAGPARHCMELDDNKSITKIYAIDNSPEMKEYCASLCRTTGETCDKLEYLIQDMTQISLPTTVDTAWLLLGSFQHMLTLADAIQCFKSIHNSLNNNGTFILELPHPNEIFGMVDCTTNTWTIPLELSEGSSAGGQLKVIWGDADDEFDPISHIRQATVGFHLTTKAYGEENEQWMETVPLKSYTVPELHLLAELTGFRIVQLLGALDSSPDQVVLLDDEELAYRLVCVLQKL